MAPKTLHLLLTIACIAVLEPTALAQLPLPPFLPIPKLPLPPFLPIPQLPLPPLPKLPLPPFLPIPQLPPLFPFPHLPQPGAPLPGIIPANQGLPEIPGVDIAKCWKSLSEVEGCVEEITKSFFRGTIGHLGHNCCKAVTDISDECWPKLFPVTPFFAPLLRLTCASAPPPAVH